MGICSQLLVGARNRLVQIGWEAGNLHDHLTSELVTAGPPCAAKRQVRLAVLEPFSLVVEDGQHRIACQVPSQESRLPAAWICRGTSCREGMVSDD